MRVLVIIPCFNEEDSIGKVLSEISALPGNENIQYLPVVVNDCSRDNTLQAVKQAGGRYLDLPVNLGIGGAVQTGFKYALQEKFDIAIQLDGDGQHPAVQLPELIAPLLSGEADVVIGSRFIENKGFQSTLFRRLGIRYLKGFTRLLTRLSISDSTSGFRALNHKALEIVCAYYPNEYPEPESLVLYALQNLRIKEIPVIMRKRQGGVSSIGRHNSIYYMVKVSLAMFFIYLRLKFQWKRSTPSSSRS